MQIEIKLDERTLEVLTKLAEAFRPAFVTNEPEPVPPAEFPEEPVPEFCNPGTPIEPPEEVETVSLEEPPSIEDLRNELYPLLKNGKREELLKILQGFNVANIKELTPEQRGAFLNTVRETLL